MDARALEALNPSLPVVIFLNSAPLSASDLGCMVLLSTFELLSSPPCGPILVEPPPLLWRIDDFDEAISPTSSTLISFPGIESPGLFKYEFEPLLASPLDSAAALSVSCSSSSYMTMLAVCRVLVYRLDVAVSLFTLLFATGSWFPKSMLWLTRDALVLVGEVREARLPAADFRFPSGDPDCILGLIFSFLLCFN